MNIYEQAVNKFGADHQILKAVEELNELAVALMHYRDGKATSEQVMNEVADVQILFEQLELIFEMESAPFVHEKLKKLEIIINK
jgi:DNA-directed RNA polymerase subunit F